MSAHRWPLRVYYEDTDAGGVVYHARYLAFAERARTEWLRELGFDHPSLAQEHDRAFVVRRASLEFHLPARLDDRLEVVTELIERRGARLRLSQDVERDARVLASIEVELVLIDHRGRPARPTGAIERALARAIVARGEP